MKNYFNYNFINKTIEGSKTSIRKANAGINPQYKELSTKLAEHPDFNVVEKPFDRKENKKTYNGLNFDRMKEYIETQPDSENKLLEFEAVQKVAEAKGSKYPLTKKWFLKAYPEYKENGVSAAEAEEQKKIEAKKKAEMLKKAAAEIEALVNEDKESEVEEVSDDYAA